MKRYFIILILPIISIFTAVAMYFSWFQGWLYFYLKHVMASVSHMGYITVGITALLLYFVTIQLVNWKINKTLFILCYMMYFGILLCLLFGKASNTQGFSSDTFGFIDTFLAGNLRVITLGNVLAFIPIGFLLKKVGFIKAIIYALMMIFAVEGAQYIMHVGFFDTGDVFLNVSGILLGYVLIRFLQLGKTKILKIKPTS
ncbi:VanZ family protein [Listeria ivanovii]|uniref:VanZ family protein n=2 Tax=Listeria ivanovii TaxID=1638 RepID=A0ABS1G8R1_LISIV|nr:VanZ family protein [Listeria ivanovii]EFR96950.1 transporter, putative [Listeria ivanovii FSL F6-596]AIS59821.1 transporter [Listeria ivanovii subsp. londoniensis]AIS62651.1 transporter [Listeria ivanovii subsp. londoniensis]MBK1962981.1 VanZ family protein [Listeria ivanovii subsp. londoniensis]MBK1967233.1 VanZ family protein [Listeria ivanovii subsp. londoniensis]